MSSENNLEKSPFKRLGKLTGMAGKVVTSYASSKLKSKFLDEEKLDEEFVKANLLNAKRIVNTLGDLKGVAMKAGQILSMQEDILPKEFTGVLSKLQKSAPPMSYSVIREQFVKEIGKSPEEIFEDFDVNCHASASVGQVHKAVMKNGQKVAVKIQYPGIDEGVDADLKNIETLVKTISLIQPKLEAKRIFEEIEGRIVEELDYKNEAENLLKYADLFADDDNVIIPKPVMELCAKRIITMEFWECETLTEFADRSEDQDEKNKFGEDLFRLFMRQLFVFRQLHADPHPGNFGRLEDGRIVLFDLGCVKLFPKDFIDNYVELLFVAMAKKWDLAHDHLLKAGFKRVRNNELSLDIYRDFGLLLLEPFFPENQPYAFHGSDVRLKVIDCYKKHMKDVTLSYTIPEHLVFLDRVIVGNYQNLRKLKAEGNYLDILEGILAEGGYQSRFKGS